MQFTHHPLMRDHADVCLIPYDLSGRLQPLINTSSFLSRDMLLCDMAAAAKVLPLTLIDNLWSPDWLSNLVEIWSVCVESCWTTREQSSQQQTGSDEPSEDWEGVWEEQTWWKGWDGGKGTYFSGGNMMEEGDGDISDVRVGVWYEAFSDTLALFTTMRGLIQVLISNM